MRYFGTDGIRGEPLKDLSLEFVLKLSKLIPILGVKHVLIGTDTRESKDMLAFQMIAGCLSQGLNVEYVGVISTPGLMYLTKIHSSIGIMITASHNPFSDNGIKLIWKGEKLAAEMEQQIEELLDQPSPEPRSIGHFYYNSKAIREYHLMLSKDIVPTSIRIGLDCANGATYKTAPMLFGLVTSQLEIIGNTPDGKNINKNCGSTHLESLARIVQEKHCDLGIAFDGDGDRVLFLNQRGEEISGDVLIYIMACYLKQNNALKQNRVALTIMSNPGIILALRKKGIDVIETPVGDKYILEAIKKYDLSLGGENSGHIILSDASFIGDGIRNAMLILRILEETHTKIEDWSREIDLYPNHLQNIQVAHKDIVMGNILQQEIKKMKDEASNDCKIIVRPSGTEDCIRISVMAKTTEVVLNFKERLKNLILSLDA